MSDKPTIRVDAGIHHVAIDYSDAGRLSVVVSKGKYPMDHTIVDVELPDLEGRYANVFEPTVKVKMDEIKVEEIK